MNILRDARWLAAAFFALVLVGCGSDGDINISADDNSTVNNPPGDGGGSNNPCASYQIPDSETIRQGSFDGTNCVYGSDFVGKGNELTVDVVIPFITGVHVFEDALIVGESIITDGSPAPTGGEGPTLTIEPGNTLAWLDSTAFLLINRGSQIIANGSAAAPITFTGFADVAGTADPEAVQLWGGMVINGNGIVNSCSDDQRAAFTCNELSEGGVDARYGGNDNAESSGTMRYVVVKHTGFEVAPGDELNGITFNAVGSGTTIEFLETFSTFDDGIEFFGGAVDITFYVGLYTRDDTIDYANGYVGNITNALVIHSGQNRAGRCIEADNDGSAFELQPLTNPTISNLTCITSGIDDPTFDDSEGPLLRRGVASQIVNSVVWDGYLGTGASSGNECFEIDDDLTRQLAENGTTTMKSTAILCNTPTQDSLTNGDTIEQWVLNTGTAATYPFNTNNAIVTRTTDLSRAFQVGGTCYYSTELLDGDENVIGSTFVDDAGTAFDVLSEGGGIVGAVSASDDWTANWTFGLNDPDLWIRSSPNCL